MSLKKSDMGERTLIRNHCGGFFARPVNRAGLFLEGGGLRPALLIFFLTALVYAPVFNAGFIWDDDAFLTKNDLILSADGLFRIWFTTEAPDYFPLVSTSLWLEWRIWGLNPFGYHVSNLLLHASGSFLLYSVLREAGIRGALFAALIFALHPVNVESAAWITERKNTLALPLYFASILFFMRFQRGQALSDYLLSILLFALSLLAKTSTVMLPFVLLGLIWARRERGGQRLRDAGVTLPFFFMALVMGMVTVWFQYNRAIGDEFIRDDGFVSRLVIAGSAVWFYLCKALLPLNLSFVYPGWGFPSVSLYAFFPLAALLFCLTIFWHNRDSWGRPLLFSSGYFFVTLFPVLGFFNIYFMKFSLVSDHWQYFAIAGPVTLAAYSFESIRERAVGIRRRVLTVTAALLILLLCTLSLSRARVFKSELALYNDTIIKNKDCWMAYNNRGHVHDRNGEPLKALQDFDRAIELKPDYAVAYFNRGVLMARIGEVEKAVEDYTRAAAFLSGYAEAYYNRGLLLLEMGRETEAFRDFSRTISVNPAFFRAYVIRGTLRAKRGSYRAALDDLNRAIELDPANSKPYVNRGVTYAMYGDLGRAVSDFTRAIELNVGEVSAYMNRSRAYRDLGNPAFAATDMKNAVRLGYIPDKGYVDELEEYEKQGVKDE